MGTQHYSAGDSRLTAILDAARDIVLAQPELWLVVGSQDALLSAMQAAGHTSLNKATMRWRLSRLLSQLRSWSPTRGPMVWRGDVATLAQWLREHPDYRAALLAELWEVGNERTATMAEAVT